MPKPQPRKTTGYLLPTPHRIRLLKANIRVFEEQGCITMVKRLRGELAMLQKKLSETP